MSDRWSKLDEFDLLLDEETETGEGISKSGMTLVALYAFYHYFNADVTKIEEVVSGLVIRDKRKNHEKSNGSCCTESRWRCN